MQKVGFLFIALVIFCSCRERTQLPIHFEETINTSDNKMLSFDLTNDDNIRATLLVRNTSTMTPHILPFKISNVSNDKNYLTSATSYEDYSVLYAQTQMKSDFPICRISFSPEITFYGPQDEDFFNTVYLNKGIYLKKSTGLDRQFVYDFSYSHKTFTFLKLSDSLNLIRVRIPDKSNIYETTGVQPIVDKKNISKFVKSYKGSNSTGVININYTIPLSKTQQRVAEKTLDLLKTLSPLLGVLIIALFIKNKKVKKGISISLAIICLGLLGFLVLGIFGNNNAISNFLFSGDNWDYLLLLLVFLIMIVFAIFGFKD